jgi:TetR/AcrR family transcriptional repressor of uid operon
VAALATSHSISVKRTVDAERRASIVAAAARAFVRFGFHAATMNQVAEEAGMSAGNLYRYFPSKEAIVEGLCALDQEERGANFALLAQSPNVFEALSNGIRQHLLSGPREKARMLLEIWAEGSRNPRVAEINRAVDADVCAGLERVFEVAKANGEAAATMDSRLAARTMFTLLGGVFKRMAHETAFDVESEATMVLGVLRAFFLGKISPEPSFGSKDVG